MSNDPSLDEQIAALEATLQLPGLPEAVRGVAEAQLRALRESGIPQPAAAGTAHVAGDATVSGPVVGVNYGKIIYGRDATEDERRRLGWYLARLAARLKNLPLRGIDPTLDERGSAIRLDQVYILLAAHRHNTRFARGVLADVQHYFVDGDPRNPPVRAYHPDVALPHQAIMQVSYSDLVERDGRRSYVLIEAGDAIAPEREISLWRRYLVVERVVREWELGHQSVLILGDPGGGKSTFLRHLAWLLALRLIGDTEHSQMLLGWDAELPHIPLLLSLRALASQLAAADPQAIVIALRRELETLGIDTASDLLNDALHSGTALLLLDGLDEVPLEATSGVIADRETVLRTVLLFGEQYPRVKLIITCRTRSFHEPLRKLAGLPMTDEHFAQSPRLPAITIAPFTLGQIRHFVPAWYAALAEAGQLDPAQVGRLKQELLDAITSAPKLQAMAATPLLLTMMALVLHREGALPRDRPLLYERILEMLLGQWDKIRDGQSLAEAIGHPNWDSSRIRPLLDQLSYEAHSGATSEDGRGRLSRQAVRDGLIAFFEQAGLPQPWESARRCLEYFEQRSGLLVADGPDSYTFAHLTLQEHCAGRHLLLSIDAADQVLARRADDRWREPILLGLGVVQRTNPVLVERVLTDLIDRDERAQPKPIEQWYRDLILGAEIGDDRDWSYLRTQRLNVDRLQRELKRGLVALLADVSQPLPAAERIRAAFLLGDLGDPRIPVTVEDWRRELAKVQAGDTSGYFCRVEAGTYWIGSDDDDPDASDEEKPRHAVTFAAPFWIARYPITNAQWHAWVLHGGTPSYSRDNPNLSLPNQPVMSVTWDMATAYCMWVSVHVMAIVRLPAESEWEAAARGQEGRRYPWGDVWQQDRVSTEEGREPQGWRWSLPVGCFPAAAAVECGALDMSGNVWEWTDSIWQCYPGAKEAFAEQNGRVMRGGSYADGSRNVRA